MRDLVILGYGQRRTLNPYLGLRLALVAGLGAVIAFCRSREHRRTGPHEWIVSSFS